MSETIVLAIDPGTELSAYMFFDGVKPLSYGKTANYSLLRGIKLEGGWFSQATHMAVEMISHYGTGMPAGKEVFETCVWIGRFWEAWFERTGGDKWGVNPNVIYRGEVKSCLCGTQKAKDQNIRQALIDRWGGELAIKPAQKCSQCKGRKLCGLGKKRGPCSLCDASGQGAPAGVLNGISADCWSALAIGVTYFEKQKLKATA